MLARPAYTQRKRAKEETKSDKLFSSSFFFSTKMMIKFYKHSLLFPEFPNVSGHSYEKADDVKRLTGESAQMHVLENKWTKNCAYIFKEHRCRRLHSTELVSFGRAIYTNIHICEFHWPQWACGTPNKIIKIGKWNFYLQLDVNGLCFCTSASFCWSLGVHGEKIPCYF